MLRVQKLHDNAILPTRSHASDAGLDLYALENTKIAPSGATSKISTGIAIELPPATVGLIWPRSKLSAKYKQLVLGGVIDAGYRGEIMVTLINHGDIPLAIKAGDKIAQLIIQPYVIAYPVESKNLSKTERGIKGINDEDERR